MPGHMAYALQCFRKVYTNQNTCAQNEQEVGDAIKDSGIPREDIFITSKVRDLPRLEFPDG